MNARNTNKYHLLRKQSHKFALQHFQEQPDSDSYQPNEENKTSISPHFWTKQEHLLLISQFRQYGADWPQVASHCPNRNQEEIKREFIHLLRKSIAVLNKNIASNNKQINTKAFWLAIEQIIAQNQTIVSQEASLECRQTIYQNIVAYLHGQLQSSQTKQYVHSFQRLIANFKKQKTRKKYSKAQTAIFNEEKLEQQLERGYLSDSSSVFQEPAQPIKVHYSLEGYDEDILESSSLDRKPSNGVMVEESQEGIKSLLMQAGLLQFSSIKESDEKSKAMESVSQNLNNESDQHFYNESELQRDCYWKKACFPND